MLLSTLGASLLENLLSGKSAIKAGGEETATSGGQDTIRAFKSF